MDDFRNKWKPSRTMDTFCGEQTQRRAMVRKSMKNALHVQRYGKWRLLAEATLNSEKIKPEALAIVELRESEGIRQAGRQAVSQLVSQSVENSVK